jgi:hypothetical protein
MPVSRDRHGFVIDASDPERATIPCPECSPAVLAYLSERRVQAQGIWQIPAYARAWTWESLARLESPAFADHAALGAAQEYAAGIALLGTPLSRREMDPGEKRGLFLFGPFGVGKTGLAVLALKECLKAGMSGAFIRTAKLLKEIKRGYNDGTSDEQVRIAETVDVLVLDDLAVERPTGWVLETLCDLLEERWSNGLATIVTCNFDVFGLRDYWRRGDMAPADVMNVGRIGERLGASCRHVLVSGENLRVASDESEAGDVQ